MLVLIWYKRYTRTQSRAKCKEVGKHMAKTSKQSVPKKRLVLKIVYIVILILALGAAIFFFARYVQVNAKYKTAVMTVDEKNQQIVNKIAKLIDLPKDEKPEVALFPDKSTFSGSPTVKAFYSSAEKGDYVVAYKSANLTVVYRDSSNKVIKSGDYVYFTAGLNPIKVAVLASADQQQAVADKISSIVLNADVVSKQQPKTTPSGSYVADATGSNAKAAQELAEKLGLSVGQLPDGETKPEGAALIVVVAPSTP